MGNWLFHTCIFCSTTIGLAKFKSSFFEAKAGLAVANNQPVVDGFWCLDIGPQAMVEQRQPSPFAPALQGPWMI